MPETATTVAAWWGSDAAVAGAAEAVGTTGATYAAGGVTAAEVAAGASAVGAASSVYSATRRPPGMPNAPPAMQMPNGASAAAAAANRSRGAAGLGSTNLTGPQGLTDPATTAQKTLLGG